MSSQIYTSKKREMQGIVSKISGKDTISVKIQGLKPHALYGKVVRVVSNYLVHDVDNTAKVGDTVTIRETRPLSKMKRWKVASILNSCGEEQEVIKETIKKVKVVEKTEKKKGAKKKT